jgi:hypothetical protein
MSTTVKLNWNPELRIYHVEDLCRKGFGDKYKVGKMMGSVTVSDGAVGCNVRLDQGTGETNLTVAGSVNSMAAILTLVPVLVLSIVKAGTMNRVENEVAAYLKEHGNIE